RDLLKIRHNSLHPFSSKNNTLFRASVFRDPTMSNDTAPLRSGCIRLADYTCNFRLHANVPSPLRLLALNSVHGFRRVAFRVAALASFLFMLGCSTSTAGEMTSTIVIGSSRIDVVFDAASWKLTQPQLLHWVQNAAEAVTTYYGRYPRPHVRIHIQ